MKRLLFILIGVCLVSGAVACRKHIPFIDADHPLHTEGGSGKMYEKSPDAIRFVQYNVGVFSKFMADSSPLCASILKSLEADVVGLNELDCNNSRHNIYQMQVFAEQKMGSEWEWNYQASMNYKGGTYGNGVMTRLGPVTDRWGNNLPCDDGSEPRSMCVIETANFVAVSAHLDNTTANSAVMAAEGLNQYVTEKYGESSKLVVLMADTNTRKTTPAMTELQKSWTIAATDGRFDYVLVLNNKAKYRVVSSAVVARSDAGDVSAASDHNPVYADIVLL